MKPKFKENYLIAYRTDRDYEFIESVFINLNNDKFYRLLGSDDSNYTHPCAYVDLSDRLITDIFNV